jgi:ribosomal protein S12 methylthiotransferase accessory factor
MIKFKKVYSITYQYKNLPFFSNGKGFSKLQARKSAFGEMCERLMTKSYFEDYFLENLYPDSKQTKNFLTKKLKKIYKIDNLTKEDLIDFNTSSKEILSIPFIRKSDNKKIYFPINLIQNLYGSNGMAYYPDEKKSFENALSEIIERFVKFKVIKEGLSLPKIKHKFNSKNIQVYDSSLGKYPVMAVSYIKNSKILLAFGCDINKQKAIKKAYLELMQGRKNFKNIGEFSDNLDDVQDSYNLENHYISNIGLIHTNFLKKSKFKTKKWNFKNYNVFKEEIYFRKQQYKNRFTYQIIIPSISEVYPIDDLIYNNRNKGKFYRDLILNYKQFPKHLIIEELEQLNPYLDLGKFIGVIFKKQILVIDFINMLKNGKVKLKFSSKYKKIKKIVKLLNQLLEN